MNISSKSGRMSLPCDWTVFRMEHRKIWLTTWTPNTSESSRSVGKLFFYSENSIFIFFLFHRNSAAKLQSMCSLKPLNNIFSQRQHFFTGRLRHWKLKLVDSLEEMQLHEHRLPASQQIQLRKKFVVWEKWHRFPHPVRIGIFIRLLVNRHSQCKCERLNHKHYSWNRVHLTLAELRQLVERNEASSTRSVRVRRKHSEKNRIKLISHTLITFVLSMIQAWKFFQPV